MKIHAFRLEYGADLKQEIEAYVEKNKIKSGVILSSVGCLYEAKIRAADGKTIKELYGNYEIVSVTGTLSVDNCHIHISIADNNLLTLGGHLQNGCLVNTTAEVVLGEIENYEFTRCMDEKTGYDELNIINI